MEREIEVRTLGGESTIIRISPDRRVLDLKILLKSSFPPAMTAPGFYLFFKGARLSLDSCIENHHIEEGEFMVLVPFTKKIQKLPAQLDLIEQDSQPPNNASASSNAESIWLDILGDISSIKEIPPDDLSKTVYNPQTTGSGEVLVAETSEKRRKVAERLDTIRDILCSNSSDIFNKKESFKICQLVQSINCLSDSSSEMCFLYEFFEEGLPGTDYCLCPLWLKRVLKTFTIVNVLYAFFHMQRKCMALGFIKEALNQSNIFGLDELCGSYMENLSTLCPKVIVILDNEENNVRSLGSAIIILALSTGISSEPLLSREPRRARRVPTSAIVNAVEKRKLVFQTEMRRLLKCFMEGKQYKGVMHCVPSLEDIISLKASESVQGCSNVKVMKSRRSTFRCSEGKQYKGVMHCVPSLEDIISLKASESVQGCSNVKVMKSRRSTFRCSETDLLKPTEIVDHLRKGMGIFGQIVHVEEIEAKLAVHVDVPDGVTDVSKAALKGIGIVKLYSHQAEALNAVLSGENVVVATSTSSGKSLCYNIPVIEALSKDMEACALYIFPTKALAQDQMRALTKLMAGIDIDFNIGIYDGDTSQMHRTWMCDNSRVLITNPDMLHLSILPYHSKFQRILSNIRIIVIDEAHIYKGAFGCHTALILRRLRRICLHVYSSNPTFIFCTATSANPREHVMELAGLNSVELIQNDGSPSGAKYFMLWNPVLQLEARTSKFSPRSPAPETVTRRSSPILEVSQLFAEVIQHGLRCITFCKTRKLSELVLCYTREILQEVASDLVDSICVYRGGYTAQDRRRIETNLFEGKLRGVAATNALELGIDVGFIDATLHLGFPGSVASLWQQAGRSGRRSSPSIAIYVAFDSPMDQYFMKFPEKILRRSVEYCQVDSHNEKVLEQHVMCAAVELQLSSQYDAKYFGPSLDHAVSSLKNKGYLITNPEAGTFKLWSYVGPEVKPSAAVSIRSIEVNRYKVIDKLSYEVLEEIEESKAFFQVYDGAVYMHQGDTYLVKSVDLSQKIACCQKTDLKFYTKTRDYTDIHVVGGDLAYPAVMTTEFSSGRRTTARVNACTVTTNWFGFYRIWRTSNQIFDKVDLSLPSFSYKSQAAWILVPQSVKVAVQKNSLSFRAGLHAASHALLNVVPLYMMCSTSDIGTECANPHETRDMPNRLLLYDQHSGGIGLSVQIQRLFHELLIAALELVSACTCLHNSGCPNCVQVLSCREYNEVLDKKAAIIILDGVLEAENTPFRSMEPSRNPSSN